MPLTPTPQTTSEERLTDTLRQCFGLTAFREGQLATLRAVMEGRDSLVVMPTGAGKSLCFQLPALLLDGVTLVISPLIALMQDQVESLQHLGLPATYINSTLSTVEQGERLRALASGRWKLCYVAPERLRNQRFMAALQQCRVSLLAVDEAHCISQWGHDFRPDYRTIGDVVRQIGHPPVIALTATATPQVQEDIERQLDLRQPFRLVTGFNRPNLRLETRFTPGDTQKQYALKTWLDTRDGDECGLIYVGRRREAADVAGFVRSYTGRACAFYHAGLSSAERSAVQQDWSEGRVPIVVATNAFGMGVDKPDVRFVVHYTMPGTVEAYYQEAGRAGRDGEASHCLLLHDPSDARLHEWFIENDAPSLEELRELYRYLRDEAKRSGPVIQSTPAYMATILGWRMDNKARTGMALLEEGGLLEDLGEQNGLGRWRLQPVTDVVDMNRVLEGVELRRAQKRHLLHTMLDYAQTHDCRRQYLLDYFGDATPPVAAWCCDNCQQSQTLPQRAAQTPEEKAALAVLDAIANLDYGIGRKRLASILRGSRASGMERYFGHPQYGLLSHLRQRAVMTMINNLVRERFLQIERDGRYALLSLSPSGKRAVKERLALPVAREPGGHRVGARAIAPEVLRNTAEETLRLFEEGHDPDAIARARGLKRGTIYNHLADLILHGRLEVERVVPDGIRHQIEAAVASVGTFYLSPIKGQLPGEIDYGEIRCVVAALQRAEVSREEGALDTQAEVRLSELNAWRSKEARQRNEPPYAILSNTTLHSLARTPPRDEAMLEAMIGTHKAALYGAGLLPLLSPQAARSSPSPAPPSAADSPLTELQERAALARLRAWRTEQAIEQHVPAYVVCSNATLRSLVLCRPRTPDELLDVPGIGPQRAERYGTMILEILREELHDI